MKGPARYGNRLLTPNAHRCLIQAANHWRVAWQSLRAAWRWQRKGF